MSRKSGMRKGMLSLEIFQTVFILLAVLLLLLGFSSSVGQE